MFINSSLMAVYGRPTKISKRARLPLTIAGLLLTAQAQAFLPTPASLMATGDLALDADAKAQIGAKQQSSDTDLTEPVALNSNIKSNNASNKDVTNRTPANQNINNTSNANIDNGNVNNAKADQLLTAWRKQAKTGNLAQHATWRRMLYFIDDKKGLFGKNKGKSLVDDQDFFLSDNGQQDSAAELDALLAALAQEMTQGAPPAADESNNEAKSHDSTAQTTSSSAISNSPVLSSSVLCRFPARVKWLTDSLNVDISALNASCPELDGWMKELAPEQLSVMFAQEYLDNPISAFGHTLLRIDSKASAADFSQIHHAYALNDTVDGDSDDSFLIYAIKATSGGYDNAIEIDPYPKKLADYLKKDERDTWTYQLDLTPEEVQQIMLHVWETKDLALPYYFTTDNCASEILRLIDVVRPEQHLLSQLPYVVIPSDVINLLKDEKLLTSTRYTPADSTVRQAQLNEAQQAAKLGYQDLSKQDAQQLKAADSNMASSMSADGKLLQPPVIGASDNNPLDRHPLQRAHIGIGQHGDNNYIDVGLRAGFHGTLDRPSGFPQFFDLEGIKATLRFYDKDDNNGKPNQPSSVELQNFTLIRGRSFNPVNSAKKDQTWGASIEATRINDGSQQDGTDHLVGSTAFEYGKSWAFGTPRSDSSGVVSGEMPPQLCYTFATGAVQAGRGINKGFRVGAGVNAGCLYQINNQLRAQAELQLPYWYHGRSDESNARGHYWQPISTLGLQYDIDKKQALRINASYDWQDRVDANEDIQLSYMRYF
ncbi:Lnb N-terminal periplasmic domain-containing protein [Psychrobacter sp. AOP22-C1-22]|uniref:Lnb N-terminal periplasmic domain-containing protein n=1 Tax=unclassified Psychrobacter TaxID=196806 RepID=UPI001CE3DE96|nr:MULTISPECIES: DUF4105 domain-containing protein [unclassified Psychrobacter]MDN5801190.1 DUF4105 domain-containing protein [Psychrobacter sp.]MDN5897428.1 DUF4105 domain-containing protein [Psychrobacter sp.]